MAEITAAAVGKLREMTNAGMMDCKKALTEAKGDMDAAVDILRKKGAATAAKKAAREAREGVIAQYIAPGGTPGRAGGSELRNRLRRPQRHVPRLLRRSRQASSPPIPTPNLEADRVAAVAKIRENIKIPRHARMEVSGNGLVAAYIHTGAKVGVLVEVGAGKEATVANDDFKQLVKDITLQIAAGHPYRGLPRAGARRRASPRKRKSPPSRSRTSRRRPSPRSSKASWRSSTRPTAWWTRAS